MENNRSRLWSVSLIASISLICVAGCGFKSTYRGPVSPYCDRYEGLFADVRMPETEAVEQAGTRWTFSKPPDEVWQACLRVVSQYEGILRLDTDGGRRRLVFVHGQPVQLKAPMAHSNRGMIFSKLLDTWVAVAVSPTEERNTTTVAAAWVSPTSGMPARPESPKAALDPAGQPNVASGGQPISTVRRYRKQIRAALAEEKDTKDPGAAWKYVPQGVINEFFYHLATQLHGPENWRRKLARRVKSPVDTSRPLKDAKPNTENENYTDLEQQSGNWASAVLRRSLPVVHCPAVTRQLQRVTDDLRQAAGREDVEVRVFVVASPEPNAFAMPNGDIFVSSGLLAVVDDLDEAAGILAHELDHLFQHDMIVRLRDIGEKKDAALIWTFVGTVTSQFAGPFVQIAAGATSAGASAATRLTSSMLGNLTSAALRLGTGALAGSIGSAMVVGYAEKAELRADANGATYVWAAGYDLDAELALLAKLMGIDEEARQRKEAIPSGFINCKPGLEKRLEMMRSRVEKLRAGGASAGPSP